MSGRTHESQEKRLEEILFSGTDPTEKVKQIMRLGFDEDIASELVERHLMGSRTMRSMPVYYETLQFDAEYDEALEEALEDYRRTRDEHRTE